MLHVMSTFCARTSVTLHTHVVGSPLGAHVGEVLALTDAHDIFHRILSDASCCTQLLLQMHHSSGLPLVCNRAILQVRHTS